MGEFVLAMTIAEQLCARKLTYDEVCSLAIAVIECDRLLTGQHADAAPLG